MGKKRKRYKIPKTKAKHDEPNHAGTKTRPQTMTTVLVYVLPILAAIFLAVAGMLYTTQKTASIWLVFGGVIISALAACLYWQQAVTAEAENPPFAVAIESAIIGSKRDKTFIGCEYNLKYLSPVPLALFVRVVNSQSIPSTISRFKVQIGLKNRLWIFPRWLDTVEVPDDLPLIWVSQPPSLSRRLELTGGHLMPLLRDKPLQPHETRQGWLLLDALSEFDSAPRPLAFRISIQDTTGQSLTNINSGPTGENILPEHFIHVGAADVDLTEFTTHHLADPN
jgi:hypothetical protein